MEGRGCRRKVFSPKKKRDRASHYKVNNGWLEKLRAAALVRVTNSRKFSKDKGCGGNLCNGEVNVASGKGGTKWFCWWPQRTLISARGGRHGWPLFFVLEAKIMPILESGFLPIKVVAFFVCVTSRPPSSDFLLFHQNHRPPVKRGAQFGLGKSQPAFKQTQVTLTSLGLLSFPWDSFCSTGSDASTSI